MKAKDLHERTLEDLHELEKTITKDLFESRFKNFTNRLDDTASLRTHRREIARIKTVLGEKARGGTPPTQKSPSVVEDKPIPKAAASKPEAKVAPPAAPSSKKAVTAKKAAAAPKSAKPKAAKAEKTETRKKK
jgi:large subunit ribosomal protein L29